MKVAWKCNKIVSKLAFQTILKEFWYLKKCLNRSKVYIQLVLVEYIKFGYPNWHFKKENDFKIKYRSECEKQYF